MIKVEKLTEFVSFFSHIVTFFLKKGKEERAGRTEDVYKRQDQGDAQAEKQRSAGTKQHVGKADRAGVGGGKDVLKHR